MITDKEIMYAFCEIIEQLEPERIIDVGMFFKSVGVVSRTILDGHISEDYYIAGVDTNSQTGLNVYKVIYDNIVELNKIDDYLKDCKKFKLAVFLSDIIPEENKRELFDKISKVSSYMLIYAKDAIYIQEDLKAINLNMDNNKFFLVCCDD